VPALMNLGLAQYMIMGFMEVHSLVMKVVALVVAILVMTLIVAPQIMLPFIKYQVRQRVSCARYLCSSEWILIEYSINYSN
jgi:hypothetical protein